MIDRQLTTERCCDVNHHALASNSLLPSHDVNTTVMFTSSGIR